MIIGQDIKDFSEDCRSRGLTQHTIATYKSNVATFLNYVDNPLNVDISTLRKFLDHLKEMEFKRGKSIKKGVHPKTIKAYFSAISTYYDFLVFNRQLEISPIPSFTKRYLSRIKQQYNGENTRQLITIDQMKQLINLDMPIQDRAILMVLVKTGIRRGELLSIDSGDLNLEKKEIILKPKAKRTNRLVIFDDETARVLQLFLDWRKTRTKTDALFISPLGLRLNKEVPNEILARHGSILGLHDPNGALNQKLTPHCMRHSFTTYLRREGMPREMIQELRGDRRKDAIDIYDHIDLSELKDRYFKCIPRLLNTEPKLHAHDLDPQKTRSQNLGGHPKEATQNRTKAILSLLDTERLTIGQIAKILKEKNTLVKKAVYRNLKNGNIQKDDLGRYYKKR